MLALACCQADQRFDQPRLICDLCAAPGGKASALVESIGTGFVLANEVIQSRVAALAYNLARTGNDRYAIASLDPQELARRLPGIFDVVLVDAPCSGQTLLGRGKQSMSAVFEKQVKHSAARARRILDAATKLVRTGGSIVFSTCTFADAENESQVDWLLDQGSLQPAPVANLAQYRSGPSGCTYRLWPHQHGCAGSFAASMMSTSSTGGDIPKQRRQKRQEVSRLPSQLADQLSSPPTRRLQQESVIYGWPEDVPDWVESVAFRGPEIAYRTGKSWRPSHESALRAENRSGWFKSVIEVDASTAKEYLSGQPIPSAADGWTVVQYQGRPLGWIKASSGIGKNHLPPAARISIDR